LSHRFTGVPLNFVAKTPLFAYIAGVPFIEEVPLKRGKAKKLINGLNTGLHGDMIPQIYR